MSADLRFFFKGYKNAIQIQGVTPDRNIDFYFPTKKSYKQFREDFYYSQNIKEESE